MRRYLKYLSYVLRHKWYVFLQCYKFGIPWLGLVHDWSKFLPSEFIPYARYFYNPDGTPKQRRDDTGYYKPADTGDAAFDFAWLLHQKRNRHHWQWWILPEDSGGIKVLQMPVKYWLEMLADWVGAGLAQGAPDTAGWYAANKEKMTLHESTREWIEDTLSGMWCGTDTPKENGGMKLVGWIRAKESDGPVLREFFNVKGKMIYNEGMGCIEYCTLDSMEAVEKLRRDWPGFYAGAFTAIDNEGNQLPRDEQPCWGMWWLNQRVK